MVKQSVLMMVMEAALAVVARETESMSKRNNLSERAGIKTPGPKVLALKLFAKHNLPYHAFEFNAALHDNNRGTAQRHLQYLAITLDNSIFFIRHNILTNRTDTLHICRRLW